jgi:hypothetical protein
LLYLACELRRRGHDNVVVCRRGGALERRAAALALPLLRLPFLTEWDPISAALLRQAAEEGADAIGAHTDIDADPQGHLTTAAGIARDAGLPLEVHVDETASPESFRLPLVLEVALELSTDLLAGEVTQEAVGHLQALFSEPDGPGALMAARAASPLLDERETAASCSILAQDLLRAFRPV